MSAFIPVVALPDWHQRQRERDDKVRRLKFNRQIMTTGGDHPSPGRLNVTRDALCLSLLSVGDSVVAGPAALTAAERGPCVETVPLDQVLIFARLGRALHGAQALSDNLG